MTMGSKVSYDCDLLGMMTQSTDVPTLLKYYMMYN
jgi:hypothetical protein